jgi:hypothetical protein
MKSIQSLCTLKIVASGAARPACGRTIWAAGCVALAAFAAGTSANGQAVLTLANNNYHAQVYNNWCGTASIEMMLDCPAVTGANTTLDNNLLAAGDGLTVPANGARPVATVVGGVVQPGGAQAFIYGITHGGGPNNNTVNGVNYFNPYVPYGVGTDSYGVVVATNLLDNPNYPHGVTTGTHVYSGWNTAPTTLGAAAATRTIVNCIADYQVPAQIVVGGGAHSMIANGAITVGQPGAPNGPAGGNGNYTLYYVEVSDPWTGYALSQPASANGTVGWGENTWLRYGYDVLGAGGIAWIAPNGQTVQNARPGMWFNCFTPSAPQASYGFGVTSYKFTVEPQGPEALDTGDPSIDGSLPAPPPLLNSQITSAAGALTYASSDVSGNSSFSSTLSSDLNAMGPGSFDSNPGDEMLLQLPGEQGDGDWLVPYDGSGGVNDVQGALLIDQDTGVVDEATWLTPQDNVPGYTLAQLDLMMNDEAQGIEPSDNPVAMPEPGTLCLLIGGGLVAAGQWLLRQRRALR